MSDEREQDELLQEERARDELTPFQGGPESTAKVLPLPGVIAIGLYMLVLAAVVGMGVQGGHFSPLLLILCGFFVLAAFGLVRNLRWAWALTLSAVSLLMSYNLWLFVTARQSPAIIQAVLNLVFFFYLVREDVRKRLR